MNSPFLEIPQAQHLASNELAFAVRDRYPVSPGHTLVVPFREVEQWWDATAAEQQAILSLVAEVRELLLDDERRAEWFPGTARPGGFNVGFNSGAAAGQTVYHLHVHVIPRYDGDMADPAGGLRHLIPGKGNYLQQMRDRTAVDASDAETTEAPSNSDTTEAPSTAEAPETTEAASPSGATATPAVLRTHGTTLVEGAAPVAATSALPTPAEHAMGRQLESGELIQRVLALLDEGRRTATYKPALLMALVELAQERADGPAALRLPLGDVAERVMELYWPHTRPYAPLGSVLRQANNPRSRILAALSELRAETAARSGTPLSRVARFYPDAYATARAAVADTLAKQPIPRLQRPGTHGLGQEYPRFLYDDADFRPEAPPRVSDPAVTLLPGVAQALARSAPLMRLAVEEVWTREVIHINKMNTDEEQLRAFLFGADRVSLQAVAAGLREAGTTTCFWCDRSLSANVHVDHVIPWSYYASDDLANLVLADATCNGDKRDRLVTSDLVARWQERDVESLQQVAEAITWPLDFSRTRTVAATAYRYLADGMPLWGGRRRISVMDAAERARVLAGLR